MIVRSVALCPAEEAMRPSRVARTIVKLISIANASVKDPPIFSFDIYIK
jgi:hypothetical protein